MKKSFKYALAIGIIKKVVLLIFLFSNYSFSQVQIQGAQPTYANPYPQPIKVQVQQNPADAYSNSFNAARNATSNSLINASIRNANYAAEQSVRNEALEDNYTRIEVDNLKGLQTSYKYIAIRKITGWAVKSNYRKIADLIKNAKKYTLLNYIPEGNSFKDRNQWRVDGDLKIFEPEIQTKFVKDTEILYLDWDRQDIDKYTRITTLTLENSKKELVYKAEFKNIPHFQMLKPVTSDYKFTKEDAKAKIMEFKEYLDLGIITQEEFQSKISEYKKILLGN